MFARYDLYIASSLDFVQIIFEFMMDRGGLCLSV